MPKLADMTPVELVAWSDNFVAVAESNPTKYGTTEAQVDALKAKADDLRAKIAAKLKADDAAKAATQAQTASRDEVEPDASYLNTVIKANKNVTDADKIALGIDVPKPASKTAPTRPEDLVANGFEDGRNVLKFDRAGNKSNTQFIIEYKKEGDTEFSYLATVTGTKYTHRGVKPGVRYTYRVKAQRAGQESTYSNEATVY